MAAGLIFMPPVMLEGPGLMDEGAWISAAFDLLSMAEAELRTD